MNYANNHAKIDFNANKGNVNAMKLPLEKVVKSVINNN